MHPKSVARATAEDVAAGRLAPASEDLALFPSSTANGSEHELPAFREPERVQFVCLDAPMLQEGELLPVGAGPGSNRHNRAWLLVTGGWGDLRHVVLHDMKAMLFELLLAVVQHSSHALCATSSVLASTAC